jgi:hypothetical protein
VDASQNRSLLSNSLDRDTLIAAGICVGCRAEKAISYSVLGPWCFGKMNQADARGFSGFKLEVQRTLRGKD